MTVVAVSLKMYFERQRTLDYVDRVARIAAGSGAVVSGAVTLAVYTDFLTLDAASRTLQGTDVLLGAQDLAAADRGACTGEVSGADLAELGVRTVEVGHFERRTLYREDESVVAAKTRAALRNGLVPMLCVGEPERTAPEAAAAAVAEQIRSALGGRATDQELWIGYEPYWAIGAPAPAPADEVRAVCTAVRERLADLVPGARLVYGGSAGPGLLTRLAPAVDGVFLGRFAHDPAALAAVVDEAAALP